MYTSCMCTEALLAVGSRRAGPFGMPGHTPLPPVNVDLEPGERGLPIFQGHRVTTHDEHAAPRADGEERSRIFSIFHFQKSCQMPFMHSRDHV